MLLLDEVVTADETHIECRVLLRPDSPFVAGDRVRSTLAVEYMAQCVAAWVGLQDHAQGLPIRIGYLVGAREVTFAVDEFRVGDDLRVEAARLWGDDMLGHFACSVRRAGDAPSPGSSPLAAATLNVYRGEIGGIS
jgi:predicted hotdog family 3-hydroxylacyl-ACP dehydratase